MSSVTSTPIKAFTPRKRLESDRLESLRAKIVKESSNLYKLPTSTSNSQINGNNNTIPASPYLTSSTSTAVSPMKNEISKFKNIPISSPSIKQEELNREHQKVGRSKLGRHYNDTLPSIVWEHPELAQIEKRIVNKELETKRVMINVIFLLISKLIYNFIELIWKKMDLQYEIHFNFNNILIGFQLLFVWNILSGLYKVLKPQDQFNDLNLTPHQRELLGLPQAPTTKTTSLEAIKPTRSFNFKDSTVSSSSSSSESSKLSTLSPNKSTESKTNDNDVVSNTISNSTTSKLLKKASTPIASPLASPSKSFSPKKTQFSASTSSSSTSSSSAAAGAGAGPSTSKLSTIAPSNQTSTPLQPKGLTQLKKQELTSTPTYIPSPKYYYRMDSPSRPRRRPL